MQTTPTDLQWLLPILIFAGLIFALFSCPLPQSLAQGFNMFTKVRTEFLETLSDSDNSKVDVSGVWEEFLCYSQVFLKKQKDWKLLKILFWLCLLCMHKRIAWLLNIIIWKRKFVVKLFILYFLYVIQNKQLYPVIPGFPGKFEIRDTGSQVICVREYVQP